MNQLVIFFTLAISITSFAQSYTLTDNVSGRTYSCGDSSGQQSNPQCSEIVSNTCLHKTNYTGSECFDLASKGCAQSTPNFPACVESTIEACLHKTNYTGSECFNKALTSCKGSDSSISDLINAATLKATQDTLRLIHKK